MPCRPPLEASMPVSRNVLVTVAPQLLQARYARQGKSFAALKCLPRICRRVVYGVIGFSTLHINIAILAASSTVVEHDKCNHVTGSHLQGQKQFTPRLPEDVISSWQVPVYVLKQKLLSYKHWSIQNGLFLLKTKLDWTPFWSKNFPSANPGQARSDHITLPPVDAMRNQELHQAAINIKPSLSDAVLLYFTFNMHWSFPSCLSTTNISH